MFRFKAKFIAGSYIFLIAISFALLILSEFFSPSFRNNYGSDIMKLLQGVVAAFIGYLTAFAAEK